RRFPDVSTRDVLIALMAAMGAICVVPLAAQWLSGAKAGGAWAAWVLMAVYSPMTGVLWPIVESYMSGGRSPRQLRASMGTFHVVWSSALVAGYWIMAPLLKIHPLAIIAGVGAIHVISIGIVLMLTPDPVGHEQSLPDHAGDVGSNGRPDHRALFIDLL